MAEALTPEENEAFRAEHPWLPPGACLVRASGTLSKDGESLFSEHTASPERMQRFVDALRQLDRDILDAAGQDQDIRL